MSSPSIAPKVKEGTLSSYSLAVDPICRFPHLSFFLTTTGRNYTRRSLIPNSFVSNSGYHCKRLQSHPTYAKFPLISLSPRHDPTRSIATMASSSAPSMSNNSDGDQPALLDGQSHELESLLSEVTSTTSAASQQTAAVYHPAEAPAGQAKAGSASAQDGTTSGLKPDKSPFWRLWAIEMVSMITSLLLLAAIVAILAAFDGVPQPGWGRRITITLNSLIAILSTLCRAMLMLVVAEGRVHPIQNKV